MGSSLQFSATDLVGHLNCHHLTNLNAQVAKGALSKPDHWDPTLEALWERGATHERAYVQHLRETGLEIVEIEGVGVAPAQVERTLAAMREGAEVIVQGAFLSGAWSGRTDVLLRVSTPSSLGGWSYEVVDTKLARETKGGTVLQLCLYSDLLANAQGLMPEQMHVVTPGSGFKPISYRTTAYAAYYRQVKRGLEQSLAKTVSAETYPHPKDHCDICRWRVPCEARRRSDDHLSLVAGISSVQMAELGCHGVTTLTELARMPLPLSWKPERGMQQSYERSREQARVQLEGRVAAKPIYETLPLVDGAGLHRLPQPSPGDIFLDLEADPFVGEQGLEYLFGYISLDAQGQAYTGEWALNRAEEKLAFERFVDFVMARWRQHPDLHIYHYAPYEPSALKRLMGRYATREDEIDRMLRGSLFVDLYTVARQSIRASVESYSIKNLEVFYDFYRRTPLIEVRSALAKLQARLELGNVAEIPDEVKQLVVSYNRDDCLSALKLRDWLEQIRSVMTGRGAVIPRPITENPEPSPELDERQRKVAELVALLTSDVPADIAGRSNEQQARWILAHTLDWHRRELKSVWWEFFRLADLPAESLLDERCAIAGLVFLGSVGGTQKAPIHRYRFPPQEVELRGGETLHLNSREKLGTVAAVDQERSTIDIKKRGDTSALHPEKAFANDIVRTDVIAEALVRIASHVAEHGISDADGPYQAARDLLLRTPPRLGHHPLRLPEESATGAALRVATKLTRGVLPIQGPPGAGKTFTAAQMICNLVRAGRRVGITANSHKVIRNLLDKVIEFASASGESIQCIQKTADKAAEVPGIRFETSNEKVLASIGASCQVAAGTAWLWSRPDAFEVVDTLFVDEAAQMSLANVLAVSQAGKSLVLLGDPQQLEQPIQGSHPEGTDVSALAHILRGAATIGSEQGLFLEETWRLHPDVCAFTSELFYEGRLRSCAGADRQAVVSTSRVSGTGLRFLPVPHEGNQNAAPEEADEIRRLVDEILESGASWIDREGVARPIRIDDILIIAPYNSQVFEIQRRLPAATVGTVDKFQGQEAPIVIYSLTTSTPLDAPRGMEFLYSLNRLNVAVSRARCICVLVASPAIFEPACGTPRQMELANAFCRYREFARPLGQ